MVKYSNPLDAVFQSLADPTRRDIIKRISLDELSVTDIAKPYKRRMSLAAVSKHLRVLEEAGITQRRRDGKRLLVSLVPGTIERANLYLEQLQTVWEKRLDRLEEHLSSKH